MRDSFNFSDWDFILCTYANIQKQTLSNFRAIERFSNEIFLKMIDIE